jgi:hypothetical protein
MIGVFTQWGASRATPRRAYLSPRQDAARVAPTRYACEDFGLITFHTEADGHAASLEWWVNLFTRTDEDVAS